VLATCEQAADVAQVPGHHQYADPHDREHLPRAAVLDRDPGNTSARMYRRVARSQGRDGTALSTRPPPAEGQG